MYYLLLPIFLLVLYLIIIFLVFKFQKNLMFRPIPLDQNAPFTFNRPFEEIWLGVRKNINALLVTVENPKGVVLYHHGNSRNLQHWDSFMKISLLEAILSFFTIITRLVKVKAC